MNFIIGQKVKIKSTQHCYNNYWQWAVKHNLNAFIYGAFPLDNMGYIIAIDKHSDDHPNETYPSYNIYGINIDGQHYIFDSEGLESI